MPSIKKDKEQAASKAENQNPAKKKLVAKKDFEIFQNDFYLKIKEGDDVSEVPEKFLVNLKTEKVI